MSRFLQNSRTKTRFPFFGLMARSRLVSTPAAPVSHLPLPQEWAPAGCLPFGSNPLFVRMTIALCPESAVSSAYTRGSYAFAAAGRSSTHTSKWISRVPPSRKSALAIRN